MAILKFLSFFSCKVSPIEWYYNYLIFDFDIKLKYLINLHNNNMKYRSRTGIVCNILDATNGGGATKTKIMYAAFLSYAQLKEYLSVLIENNLLEYSNGTQFKTTEKGLNYLKMYREIGELLQQQTTAIKND